LRPSHVPDAPTHASLKRAMHDDSDTAASAVHEDMQGVR
jgi:hypothetical protein